MLKKYMEKTIPEANTAKIQSSVQKEDSEETKYIVRKTGSGDVKANIWEADSKEAEGVTRETEDSAKEEPIWPHNIYDRIAKRCLSLSARCTVNLINGLFGTDYQPGSDVQYNWTENVDDGLKQTLSDTIITINGSRSYHCEFQMTADGEMILRMLEYGFHHAVKSRTGLDVLEFPEPLVVYLNEGEKVPETYKICIRFGTQGEFEYEAPVCQYLEETREDAKKRDQLIVLVPFQLLRLKRVVEICVNSKN